MSRSRHSRDLNFYYPTAAYTGYGEEKTERRFSVLHGIPDLGSMNLLDIGSGRCNLLTWLRSNGYQTHYEAVDIREDSLRLCPCPPTHTHTGAPTHPRTGARGWDIVCLFGTVTFNIGSDQGANRRMLLDLLFQSVSLQPRHIVFTVIRSDRLHGLDAIQLIGFSKDQIMELIRCLEPTEHSIHEDLDPNEWIVRCSFASDK